MRVSQREGADLHAIVQLGGLYSYEGGLGAVSVCIRARKFDYSGRTHVPPRSGSYVTSGSEPCRTTTSVSWHVTNAYT
eukprot:4635141-Prymnesium_polylepis.1